MIGVFDSGVGGLFALRALRACLPRADLVYYADTRNLPYGGREAWELLALSRRAILRLQACGARAVLAACGTVSSTVLPQLREETDLPLYGIIAPTAEAVQRTLGGGEVLLLGTQATVQAGVLQRALEERVGRGRVRALACPSLVSMAECGRTDRAALCRLLAPHLTRETGAVVLGCTHFSRLAPDIAALAPRAAIIDGAREAAWAFAAALPHALTRGEGRCLLGASGDETDFLRKARQILGEHTQVGRL